MRNLDSFEICFFFADWEYVVKYVLEIRTSLDCLHLKVDNFTTIQEV